MELIAACLRRGVRVAVVVCRGQYLDSATLALMRQALRLLPSADAAGIASKPPHGTADFTGSGRWLWLVSVTPLFGGCSPSRIENELELTADVRQCLLRSLRSASATSSAGDAPDGSSSSLQNVGGRRHLTLHGIDEAAAQAVIAGFGGVISDVVTTQKLLSKCRRWVGWLHTFVEYFFPLAFQVSMAIERGDVLPDKCLSWVNPEGWRATAYGCSELKQASWRNCGGGARDSLTSLIDGLPPSDQILLKIVACIDVIAGTPCPWGAACEVAGHFLRDTTVEELRARMASLVDLLLIDTDLRDPGQPAVFVTPPLAEVVAELLTPNHTRVVCRKFHDIIQRDFDKRQQEARRSHDASPSSPLDMARHYLAVVKVLVPGRDEKRILAAVRSCQRVMANIGSQYHESADALRTDLVCTSTRVRAGPEEPKKDDGRPDEAARWKTNLLTAATAACIARTCEPPLVLGPIAGRIAEVQLTYGFHCFPTVPPRRAPDRRYVVATLRLRSFVDGLPSHVDGAPSFKEVTTEQREQLAAAGVADDAVGRPWDDAREQAVFNRCLAETEVDNVRVRLLNPATFDQAVAQLNSIGRDFVLWFNEVIRPMSRLVVHMAASRVIHWDDIVASRHAFDASPQCDIGEKEIEHQGTTGSAGERCASAASALRRAYAAVEAVVDDTPGETKVFAVRDALTQLGVGNWMSEYAYMTPARLRDCWLKEWISCVEFKAILMLFALIEPLQM